MNTDPHRLVYLFRQYVQKISTREELHELLQFHNNPEYKEQLFNMYREAEESVPLSADYIDWENMYTEITNSAASAKAAHRVHFLRRSWVRYAALLLLVTMVYFLYDNSSKRKETQNTLASAPAIDVAPAGNNAILTLADGSTIILDNLPGGQVAKQGDASVIKTRDGELVYQADTRIARSEKILYNKITTPRGGNYQVTLPDGTRVWLNAASSVTYPSSFIEKIRSVTVSGEVYLEVAADPGKPFRVLTDDMEIDVLGTAFNINSYADEPVVNTTLVEGSVRIKTGTENTMLKPGWQGILRRQTAGVPLAIQKADVDQATAWKNGLFIFSGADLPTVLRELSRWYDVDVIYEGKIPQRKFGGKIQRDLNLSQVLGILKKMEVNFSIEEGKKLIVKP